MSIIACKYFDNLGWVLAKNRDRNYKPNIRVMKSFRNGIERLLLWDEKTKYTEGLNEFGVAIISASVAVDLDEREGSIATKQNSKFKKTPRVYYSPDGLRLRTALFERSASEAAKKILELQIAGNTIVADKERCFLIEAGFIDTDEYVYEIMEVPKDKIAVRTNHGIFLPWTGYNPEIPEESNKREASEVRYNKVNQTLRAVNNLEQFIDVMSDASANDAQLNPLRIDPKKGSMRTTGQIFIIPKQKTLHYRAIWCSTIFDLDKLNSPEEKTFFEVVSTRKLISFTEYTA
jgi:hypothetical protein